jgi:Lon protease-like protein
MTEFTNGEQLPADFTGVVRLFPLPNLVMFPHVVQPLHVFEPRYISMVEEALAGDQLLAMALFQPGWESQYNERPAIHPVVCVGRVISHNLLDNGKYSLLLQGLKRAAIVREKPPADPFRVADVAILEDLYPAGGGACRSRLRNELIESFETLFPESPAGAEQIDQVQSEQLSLGAIVDIVAYSLELDLSSKQRLLAEWNVDLRAVMLLEQLRMLARGEQPAAVKFPPGFSNN